MKGVLCITKDGKPSYCKAPPEKRGIGRCNHIAHINPGETIEAFMDRCMQADAGAAGSVPGAAGEGAIGRAGTGLVMVLSVNGRAGLPGNFF